MAHPRMYDDANPLIGRLRTVCLALPEAFEKEAWGECTFRVAGGSMFAMTDNNHHNSGHVAVWVKAPPMVQEILVNSAPERFFVPPYVGPKGWVGMRLDQKVDWDELADIVRDGYLMSAPKRLRARMESTDEETAPRPHGATERGAASRSRPTPKTQPGRKGPRRKPSARARARQR